MTYRECREKMNAVEQAYRAQFGDRIGYGTEEFQWSPEQYIEELQRCIDTGKSLIDYYGEPDRDCLY